MDEDISSKELLYGTPAIARFLGLTERQIYHLKDTAGLPAFKIGRKVCANKSKLNEWLKAREATAPSPSAASDGLA